MVPYLDCPHPDSSGITLEYYDSLPKIRFLEDGTTVKLHRHDFYEMVLILRGSCRHFYRSTYIPLMPGDLFLIPPDQPHSYRFHDSIAMCNCQFYRRILEHEPEQFIAGIEYTALQQKMPMRKRFEDIQAVWADSDPAGVCRQYQQPGDHPSGPRGTELYFRPSGTNPERAGGAEVRL